MNNGTYRFNKKAANGEDLLKAVALICLTPKCKAVVDDDGHEYCAICIEERRERIRDAKRDA
jgi:hypothetical protein